MDINKSKGVIAKNRAHKLKSGVNWQGQLKQKRCRTCGRKTGLSRNYCSTTKSAEAKSRSKTWKEHIDAYLMHGSCKRRTLNESYVFKDFSHITFTAALQSVLFTVRRLRTTGSRMSTTCTVKANSSNSPSETVAYPRIFFGGGVQKIQLRTEDRENEDLGAVAPLVRGSGGSCNLVQEISYHIVKFS